MADSTCWDSSVVECTTGKSDLIPIGANFAIGFFSRDSVESTEFTECIFIRENTNEGS